MVNQAPCAQLSLNTAATGNKPTNTALASRLDAVAREALT
jgi:hypothetical protein